MLSWVRLMSYLRSYNKWEIPLIIICDIINTNIRFVRSDFMTIEEMAYIAGIIDGEGSIMLLKFHNNQFPSPCISVASTSLELLEWLKRKVGYGTIKAKKNYKPTNHENSYTYTIRYNNVIDLLDKIEPFLVIPSKKSRAQMILSEYKQITPRNGRYSNQLLLAKEDLYKRFMNV